MYRRRMHQVRRQLHERNVHEAQRKAQAHAASQLVKLCEHVFDRLKEGGHIYTQLLGGWSGTRRR